MINCKNPFQFKFTTNKYKILKNNHILNLTKIWTPQKLSTIQYTQHVAQQVCNVHYSTQQVTVYNRSSTCTHGILRKSFHQVHEPSWAVHEGLTVCKLFMNITMSNNKCISTSAMSNFLCIIITYSVMIQY